MANPNPQKIVKYKLTKTERNRLIKTMSEIIMENFETEVVYEADEYFEKHKEYLDKELINLNNKYRRLLDKTENIHELSTYITEEINKIQIDNDINLYNIQKSERLKTLKEIQTILNK